MIIKNFQSLNLESLKLTEELKEIINSLSYSSHDFSKCKLSKLKKDEMIMNSRKLFEILSVELHKIPYISSNSINGIINTSNNVNQIIERILEKEVNISPLEVPISFCNENYFYGKCTPSYIKDNDKHLLVFNEFELSSNTHVLTPSIYVHEIIHSQLESKDNSISDYLNYEVLPVFFDKISPIENKLPESISKINDLLRLKQLIKAFIMFNKGNLPEFSKIKLSMIITSLLKSELLFELYINGDKSSKIKILYEIQSVLDGKYSIETFLDNNNINLESSINLEIIKKRMVMKNGRIPL